MEATLIDCLGALVRHGRLVALPIIHAAHLGGLTLPRRDGRTPSCTMSCILR